MKVCLSCGLYRKEEEFPVIGEYLDVCLDCLNNEDDTDEEFNLTTNCGTIPEELSKEAKE